MWAAEYGRRVISISPPGVETVALQAEKYRLSELAALVVRLFDVLDFERAAFVGHSWGASIGCHLAARYPQRLSALALLDAGYQDIPDDGKDLHARVEEARSDSEGFRFSSWEAFLEVVRGWYPHWRPELEERLRAGMRKDDGQVVVTASPEAGAAALQGVISEPPTRQLAVIGRLDLPVLLVVSSERGDTDEGVSAIRRFSEEVPHAIVERVPDSGHDLLADQPEATIRVVGEFLRRVDSLS